MFSARTNLYTALIYILEPPCYTIYDWRPWILETTRHIYFSAGTIPSTITGIIRTSLIITCLRYTLHYIISSIPQSYSHKQLVATVHDNSMS